MLLSIVNNEALTEVLRINHVPTGTSNGLIEMHSKMKWIVQITTSLCFQGIIRTSSHMYQLCMRENCHNRRKLNDLGLRN